MSQALQRSPEGSATSTIGSPFIELQSVDSTNNYARQQIHAGLAQHGMVIYAYEQTTGRGQRGRVWASEKDMNITLSVLVKPRPLLLNQQFQLSACVALAMHEFFMKYAIDKSSIKWPNDLYWQDRKAGGVLIESIVSSREPGVDNISSVWDWAIVGIGININQVVFPGHLPNPVSLKQITGNTFTIVPMAKELCQVLQHYFHELTTTGFENIYRLYNLHLYKINETVRLKKDNRVFEALIKGVSPEGKLITQHALEEEFDFGEVEWLL